MDEAKVGETLDGKLRRRRRSREECEKLLKKYKESGLTQGQYAAREGIHIGTLRRWLSRIKEKTAKRRGSQFAAVKVSGARAGSVTLRWPQGIELEIATELEGSEVTNLVRELLNACLR
jgi:transposase